MKYAWCRMVSPGARSNPWSADAAGGYTAALGGIVVIGPVSDADTGGGAGGMADELGEVGNAEKPGPVDDATPLGADAPPVGSVTGLPHPVQKREDGDSGCWQRSQLATGPNLFQAGEVGFLSEAASSWRCGSIRGFVYRKGYISRESQLPWRGHGPRVMWLPARPGSSVLWCLRSQTRRGPIRSAYSGAGPRPGRDDREASVRASGGPGAGRRPAPVTRTIANPAAPQPTPLFPNPFGVSTGSAGDLPALLMPAVLVGTALTDEGESGRCSSC